MRKERKTNPCVFCYYARMRTDICGSETEGSSNDDQ